jgi:uncharacterized repeat protein (TIGR03837 family)
MNVTTIDIFCSVIDNFGDIGVVYRFATALQRHYQQAQIRVYVDDLMTFSKINHYVNPSAAVQSIAGITYIDTNSVTPETYSNEVPAKLLIEAFGCLIPDFIMKRAYYESELLINLEYLSAENWVDGYHMMESLLPEGTLKKYFFMPGFSLNTGGVILNHDTPSQQELHTPNRFVFLNRTIDKYDYRFTPDFSGITGLVFTYTRNMSALISCIVNECTAMPFTLLVFGQKSRLSIIHYLTEQGVFDTYKNVVAHKNCTFIFMENIPQEDFDKLLYFTDFNIVRGEDSLVRAILTGNPFIWNAYIQDNKYQKVKVGALCETMEQFFESAYDFKEYHQLMLAFNDIEGEDLQIPPSENFKYFFNNLNIFKHATQKMCYFVHRHCNLIEKISVFIESFRNNQ